MFRFSLILAQRGLDHRRSEAPPAPSVRTDAWKRDDVSACVVLGHALGDEDTQHIYNLQTLREWILMLEKVYKECKVLHLATVMHTLVTLRQEEHASVDEFMRLMREVKACGDNLNWFNVLFSLSLLSLWVNAVLRVEHTYAQCDKTLSVDEFMGTLLAEEAMKNVRAKDSTVTEHMFLT
jgi:hypothetical protein